MANTSSQTHDQFGVAEGLRNHPTIGESVIVLIAHPDPSNLESVSLATSRAQAKRLLTDLTNLMAPFIVLAAVLFATLGCSAKVEVERANRTSSTTATEKAKTAVEVDLLQSRSPEPPPVPKPANSTMIINVGTGNIHVGEAPAQIQPSDKRARPRNGLNTAIGFPSTYTVHGPLAFLGYIAVCLLVGAAVVLMMMTVGRKTGGPLLPTIVLLVAAAVILQTLPQAESGFQVMPQLPWHCSGVFSTLASILCWAGILLAVLIAVTGCLDAPKVFSGLVLTVMGMNLLVSFGGGLGGTEVVSVLSKSQVATVARQAAVPVAPPQARPPEPVATPKAPESPRPVDSESRPVTISNNTFVFNYRAGDTHNENHIHLHEPPPKVKERVVIRRQVEAKPPRRPIEDPCDRGQKEHEERVRRWRQFPKGF